MPPGGVGAVSVGDLDVGAGGGFKQMASISGASRGAVAWLALLLTGGCGEAPPPARAGADEAPLAELQRALAAASAPAAWRAAAERVGTIDPQAITVLELDQDFRLLQCPGRAGRAGNGLVAALRRPAAGAPFAPTGVAVLPALKLLDALVPIAADEFPDAALRRLVLLLDGLLRAALTGGSPPVEEFLSVEGPPWRGGEWAPFLTASIPDDVLRTASIASFAVRARAEFALLAAARIDLLDEPLDPDSGAASTALATPPRSQECLVLYRPLHPGIGGTAWGVAWVMEVGTLAAE